MDEFARVLRAWRDRVQPEHVGLPPGTGRRARGLRREELAMLAGVSVDYIVRLEQGRATNPSAQLLGALARALRLTDEERDHLYRVAGVATPTPASLPRHVGPSVQRIVDRLGDVPVGVFSAAHDLLLWNPLWAALLGDPSLLAGFKHNLVWRVFTEENTRVTHTAVGEDEFRADLVADLRSAVGRYPDDAPLRDLVDRLLSESDEFAAHWEQAHVALHRSSRKTVHTRTVGDITVDCDVLSAPGSGDLRIVVYTVAPGSADAAKLDLLRVAGLQDLTHH
ncbi:helix-turn-helix domain-containing protein [Rhodococcus globerulus]|uniref:Helix-turn-helix transcriptional regulator n=1 Tax=Rhodococcus globerulus TaxID=33008 RepID=A0ABU4BRF6_RHOGO|nr:helix-turn-helix transcriptional regulator [Rhodococcus globerulus]MDV6266679.1 helix-turn-helix transcriptional regulator [Rhodococcus globerulus]